ncbi:MAG TPA: pyridoxal phosphate-dependent aminotransferase [Clostridia bacterium]|jgi:aspartate aminotransferase|nr:pyridoxal phosphate-dependent aminotransferase [Clostridia bacterium]
MAIAKKVKENLNKSSWIRKMFEEGERMRKELGPERVFDFTLGNPAFEPPELFKENLRKIAEHPIPGMHKYMSNAGYPETRKAIGDYLSKQTGLKVTENHVVMTCGAGGALNVVLKTILDPGDEVIVIAPYFVEYGFYVDNHQGKLVVVDSKEDFQIDIQALDRAISQRTKAIIINSPNNPTGVIYPREILQELNELLERRCKELGKTIYVISDEPYAKLVYDGVEVPPVFNCIKNSILVTSHSKDLALPGERIGYIAINPLMEEDEELFAGFVFANRILGFVNAPALMQRLIAPLQGLAAGVEEYCKRRDLLVDHLQSIGFKVVKPQGAFYIFPQSPIADDVEFIQRATKYGILLVPGSGFGRPGYFRISYCVDEDVIRRSLPAFTELAKEFGLC